MMNIYLRTILRKLNTRAVAMLIALILVSSGVVMIFNQITDVGMIDIKSPIISGKLSTGFVGISLIFFALLIVTVMFKTSTQITQEITIQIGKAKVTYKNMPYDKIIELNSLIRDLQSTTGNSLTLEKEVVKIPNKVEKIGESKRDRERKGGGQSQSEPTKDPGQRHSQRVEEPERRL